MPENRLLINPIMDPVAQIREKIDIVALLSEYMTVKKAGRNFQALCPFHGEKSPSFIISPERQLYHCFGCQKGGDIYSFLMDYEHMEFPEALRFLAKRAGVDLQESSYQTATGSKKEVLYKINALTAEYYHYILSNLPAGRQALAYLQGRNIDERLLKTFKIGFSPSSGKALANYLIQKKKFDVADLVEAGLVTARGRDVYDFFRGRLMFPLIDHRDNVLGFSGRLLDEKTGFGGKYINTRDTIIYHKRSHFFGMNITREAIRKENQAILVEGEFDVMSCFQHGIGNVLAVKGTALTEQQVNLLSRYAQKVSICFDGDAAGQEAIKRSLPIIEKKGLTTTVIVIPSGKDPDEALKTDPIGFKKAVKADKSVYDYLFDFAMEHYPVTSPEGKQKIGEALLPVITGIENAIVKEHYLRKLSTAIQTTYESITKEMERLQKKEYTEVKVPVTKQQRSREEILEEYISSLIIQYAHPKIALQKALDILSGSLSNERAYQKIMSHLLTYFETSHAFDQKQFGDGLPQELHMAYNTSLLFPLSVFENTDKHMQEVEKVAHQLRTVYLKQRLKRLNDHIKEKEQAGEQDEVARLQEEYSQVATQLKK